MKKITNILLWILILAVLFFSLYISTYSILIPIVNAIRNENTFFYKNLFAISIIIPTILTLIFTLVYKKRKDFLQFTAISLAILFSSFLIGSFLAIVFGNSEYWYLKYTLGVFVGTISFLLMRNRNNDYKMELTGLISLFALFICENIEYLWLFDPTPYSSTIYPQSFPNKFIWLIFILLVVIPSSILSKGFLLNKLLKNRISKNKLEHFN